MKKSLVALAALSATAAMAQVTISGLVDFAGASVTGTQVTQKGTTVSTTVGTSATSVIRFIAVEDIGGGTKVTGQYNLDPRTLANDSYTVANNTGSAANAAATTTTLGTTTAQGNTVTGLARDEVFVGISGGFGNLRLGAPNTIALNSFQVGSPLGTGIGSGYTAGSTASTMTNAYTTTRYNRAVRFDSPSMNGFTVAFQYAPGNDQVVANTTATTTAGAVPIAQLIPNARQFTEFGLRYDNGPMSVAYARISSKAMVNLGGFYNLGTNTAGTKTETNTVNASYNLGSTTLYAGLVDGDLLTTFASATALPTTVKATRFGVKQSVGAVDLLAMTTTQKDTVVAGTEYKRTLTGFRVEYNLSKTSAAYLGAEKYNSGQDYSGNTSTNATLTGTRNITSMGLRTSF